MTLALARVDQKLIHGQVVVAWVPHLNADTIVVADRETADDIWLQRALRLGLPPEIKKSAFVDPAQLAGLMSEPSMLKSKILLLFRDLKSVKIALTNGFTIDSLNLGNQIYAPDETALHLTDSFFASQTDLEFLAELENLGLILILQAMPTSKAVKWSAGLEHK